MNLPKSKFHILLVLCTVSSWTAKAAEMEPYFPTISATYRAAPVYPRKGVKLGAVGSVELIFMIDKTGRAFSPMILNSSEIFFESSAVNALKKYKYSAQADSVTDYIGRSSVVINYEMESSPPGPYRRFIKQYNKIADELASHEASKEKLRKSLDNILRPRSLPHQAIGHSRMLEYEYARKFGSLQEQLQALQLGLPFLYQGGQKNDQIEQLRIYALQNIIRIHLIRKNYGDALFNFELLSKLNESSVAVFLDSMSKIYSVIGNDESFETPFKISERKDSPHYLLKKKVTVKGISGTLNSVVLRCDREYKEMNYKEGFSFEIPKSWGSCHLQIVGEAGATGTLVQS